MDDLFHQRAALFKALADPRRQEILSLLQNGELCACKLIEATGMVQSTLSYHMKILCGAGIVRGREAGKWIHYAIDPVGCAQAIGILEQIAAPNPCAPCPTCQTSNISHINKEETNVNQPKLYILTGFLGSGKTTLLLNILHHLKGHKVGVIQNEFGKLSIDGDILRSGDIQMVEITRGSIFCTCLQLKFVEALSEMAKQDFEYLFVESSGLGDPSNVQSILDAAEIAAGKKMDFRGVICLVDAKNFWEQIHDGDYVNRQLRHCHLAAITKRDLVEDAALPAIVDKIRTINPLCRLEECSMGNLDLGFLREDLLRYQFAPPEEALDLRKNKPKTLFLNFEGQVERQQLMNFFAPILPDIYRAKGFFHILEEGWMQVDVVGSQIDFKPCQPCQLSQLVFISKIGPNIIKPLLDSWDNAVGQPMQLKN